MGTSHQGKQGNQGKLAGKVALITGGARGLGRGYALRLAGLGADIAIIDRDLGGAQVYEFERAQMTAETVTAECEALGVRAIGIEGDLTDRSATEAAVAQIVAALGGVDIAVCNAGGGVARFADERGASASDSGDLNTEATPADCPQDVLTRVLDINLMTCMYTCMAVAPHMKRRRAGKIVTVASSHVCTPGLAIIPTVCTPGLAIIPTASPRRRSSTTPSRWPRSSAPTTSTSTPSRRR